MDETWTLLFLYTTMAGAISKHTVNPLGLPPTIGYAHYPSNHEPSLHSYKYLYGEDVLCQKICWRTDPLRNQSPFKYLSHSILTPVPGNSTYFSINLSQIVIVYGKVMQTHANCLCRDIVMSSKDVGFSRSWWSEVREWLVPVKPSEQLSRTQGCCLRIRMWIMKG